MSKYSPRRRRLDVALGSMPIPPGILISRMDRLRQADEHARADRLALEAVTGNPATVVGMLTILRAAGRDTDAQMFLRLIASTRAETYGTLVHELHASGAVAETHGLIGLLQARPAAELATAAAAFTRSAMDSRGDGPRQRGHDEALDNPLLSLLAAGPVEGLVAELVLVRAERRDDEAAVLLAALGQRSPLILCEVAAELARLSLTADAGYLLSHAARHAEPADLALLFIQLAQSWGRAAERVAPIAAARDDVAAFLAALKALAPEEYPGILARRLIRAQVVELFRMLTGRAAHGLVDDLVGWCARHDEALFLTPMLHEAGMHSVAYRLAERHAGG